MLDYLRNRQWDAWGGARPVRCVRDSQFNLILLRVHVVPLTLPRYVWLRLTASFGLRGRLWPSPVRAMQSQAYRSGIF